MLNNAFLYVFMLLKFLLSYRFQDVGTLKYRLLMYIFFC